MKRKLLIMCLENMENWLKPTNHGDKIQQIETIIYCFGFNERIARDRTQFFLTCCNSKHVIVMYAQDHRLSYKFSCLKSLIYVDWWNLIKSFWESF